MELLRSRIVNRPSLRRQYCHFLLFYSEKIRLHNYISLIIKKLKKYSILKNQPFFLRLYRSPNFIMFREENHTFGLSAAEEKQRNRDVVKGTTLSFFALCGFIRICKHFVYLQFNYIILTHCYD